MDATRWSAKPLTVDDILTARCADLGTIEHATSLLESVAEAVSEEADALFIAGGDMEHVELVNLVASVLNSRNRIAGVPS